MKTDRFKRRRATLRALGRCQRCGAEPAAPGHTLCKLCAAEMITKKHLRPAARLRCEKIARLERNRALFAEALDTVTATLAHLRSA